MQTYALAKINLFLHITGRRKDGLHTLRSLFAKLSLSDRVHIKPILNGRYLPKCKMLYSTAIKSRIRGKNIVLKAAEVLQSYKEPRDNTITHDYITPLILIQKNIPISAGLGGGSADAAAVLSLLIQLWGLHIDDQTLNQICLKIGSDVPFCLKQAHCCLVEGIGEILTKVTLNHTLYVVVVCPDFELKSIDVYKKYTLINKNKFTQINIPPLSINNTSTFLAQIESDVIGRNDLYEAAISLKPQIANIIREIRNQKNCIVSKLSGSGPACFGIFEDEESAAKALYALIKRMPPSWIVHKDSLCI